MTERIGAIETAFAGCRFRSRLEARWAVFFDHLGVEWKYEPQGYEIDGAKYLPDFYLPKIGAWVEVKGDPESLRADFARMSKIFGPGSPLPGLDDSFERQNSIGVLLLGDVPRTQGKTPFHPFLRLGASGLVRCWAAFLPRKHNDGLLIVESDRDFARIMGLGIEIHLERSAEDKGWRVECRLVETLVGDRMVEGAYDVARQARFEHGERGH